MGCQSSPSTMLVCIIRQEDMEIYIYIYACRKCGYGCVGRNLYK